MLQNIIVFIIIGGAIAYTVFTVIRSLGKKENPAAMAVTVVI